eukprot:Sspe_Gene.84919::Locus_55758_Transcript_1_1_Confidence_1.000_Length_2042::g.84919::m.84919
MGFAARTGRALRAAHVERAFRDKATPSSVYNETSRARSRNVGLYKGLDDPRNAVLRKELTGSRLPMTFRSSHAYQSFLRRTSYGGLLIWYFRRTAYERPGKRALGVANFLTARLAPDPYQVYLDLDEKGWFWEDDDVATLLGTTAKRMVDWKGDLDAKYVEVAQKFIEHIATWPNTGLHTKHRMLTLLALLGEDAKVEEGFEALRGYKDGPLQAEDYAAPMVGYARVRNIEKAVWWYNQAAENGVGIVREAVYLAEAFAAVLRFRELHDLIEQSKGAVVTQKTIQLGMNAALDNGHPDEALELAHVASAHGISFAGDFLRGRLMWGVSSAAAGERALELLRKWMGGPAVLPSTSESRPMAPPDALIIRALEIGCPSIAEKAFELVQTVNASRLTFPLALKSCEALLGAAVVQTNDALVARVLEHMIETCVRVRYTTLVHLNMAVMETVWDSRHLIRRVLTLLPNFPDRLLYYFPGFQSFTPPRKPVSTFAQLRPLLSHVSTVVVHHTALLSKATQLLDEAASSQLLIIPFSTLASLQLLGDDMRERGISNNPADAALRKVGAALSGSAPCAARIEVLNTVEQRLLTLQGEVPLDHLDPSEDDDKFLALVSSLKKGLDDPPFLTTAVDDPALASRLASVSA